MQKLKLDSPQASSRDYEPFSQSGQGDTLTTGIVRGIVKTHLEVAAIDEKGNKTPVDLAQILEGKDSFLNTPSSYQTSHLPPLPLDAHELDQLKEILGQLPVTVTTLKLIDVLGFTVYDALDCLHQAAQRDKHPSLKQVFPELKKQFCRLWLLGIFSQQGCTQKPGMSGPNFIKNMQKFSQSVNLNSQLPDQHPYQDHYASIGNSVSILLKMWQSENACQLLLDNSCYRLQQLTSWLPQKKEARKAHYTIKACKHFLIL